MCVDANAGARAQARAQAAAKDARYASESLKFWNRETTLERTYNQNIIGLTKDQSDAYAQALATQGKGRRKVEDAAKAYFTKMSVDEGGRSRRFGKLKYLELLQKNADVEATVQNVFGRNEAYSQEGIKRVYQAKQASAREALGVRPEYGAPVMMPPSDRFSTFLNFGMGLASIFYTPSDISTKENIEYVGSSPQGHNIWEFNYQGDSTRYRGAMAQEVAKLNPDAVHVVDDILHVDYSKIDVDMVEVT